jgi:hypothetical protein
MGSTFDPLARRSGALPGTIEREWLVWALRDEVRRGRIAYDSTSHRYVLTAVCPTT